MKKSYAVDMVNGPLLSRILIYAFPLILSGVLQLLFNAADIVVVGKFTGSHSRHDGRRPDRQDGTS